MILCSTFATTAALVRFAPSVATRVPAHSVQLIALASAVAAAFAPPQPTGWVPLDVLCRAGIGGAAVLAACERPMATAWAGALLTVGLAVADSPAWFAAPGALGIVVALVLAGIEAPLLLAFAGGALAQAALRLDWEVATGASLALAAVALVPMLVAGLAGAGPPWRRRLLLAGGATVLLCAAGAATGGTAALRARGDVDRGVRAAREGLSLLVSEDRSGARSRLAEAAEAFEAAEDALRAPWARPAFAVPVVAQHARAVATLASAGADLATTAIDTLDRADPESVRPENGRIDVAAVRALAEPLQEALDALVRADERLEDVDSPWLVAPVSDRRDELHERVTEALEHAETAATAARLAPGMLGADGPRRYLIVVITPAESTGGGGFLGNFGELVTDDGRIELARFGRNIELTNGGPDPDGRRIEGHDDYLRRYGPLRPQAAWGLINLSPDFPTVADVMAQLYPQSGGAEVDGVIAVDPYGIAALLSVVGPIEVAGWPEPLTGDNAPRILLHEQYLRFPSSSSGGDVDTAEERVDFLGAAARTLFGRITEGRLPGPGRLATALGPAVRGRHLQLSATAPEEQRFFERIGADGALPDSSGDVIGVVGQNYNGNKIDWFLHRNAAYDVVWDPGTGAVRGEFSVTLRNEAPASGLPHGVIGWGGDEARGQLPVAEGENLMLVQLYSALPLSSLTVDGDQVEHSVERERGLEVAVFFVRVPPGGTATVRAVAEGRLNGRTYRFEPVRQAMVNPDELEVRVAVTEGWRLGAVTGLRTTGAAAARDEWSLEERRAVEVTARPEDESLLDRLRGRDR